jgi:hypothetical protein
MGAFSAYTTSRVPQSCQGPRAKSQEREMRVLSGLDQRRVNGWKSGVRFLPPLNHDSLAGLMRCDL